ncbi:MAG: translation initiation factor IF-2 [Candidatus Micrarchaeota archaeon]|nr:translation initiation factor IF-2 [Candidatus Micrarchaeota archaeon]
MIRQPIISVLGHVDHGKTTLLDRIRNTAMASREAGGITQHIGASEVPIDVITAICGPLLGSKINLPGLLFIDTPGHEAFTNLRRRGGSVSDLAILVVDVSKGFEPQTVEAIEILKEYKTPFVVAANKVDLVTGWRSTGSKSFMESLAQQNMQVQQEIENRIYTMVGDLSAHGFTSERFDRIKDFQKELAIIPLSAKTGEGLAELMMVVSGLAQKFLEMKLEIEVSGPGRGSIFEKKEVKGLGITIDAILYNGTLKVGDTIAFATENGVATAKIRALLKPKPLQDIRESSSKFYDIDEVSAASGIKISGVGLDDALPGSPLIQVSDKDYADEIKAEMGDIFKTEKVGVVLKTDSIGSLEAISRLLINAGFRISKKGLGVVTKRDVIDAFAMYEKDPSAAAVLTFNVPIDEEAKEASSASGVRIIESDIIYKLIDDYRLFVDESQKRRLQRAEEAIIFPGVIEPLPNMAFRISHPAIFGVKVVAGRIKQGWAIMNEAGEVVGSVKGIQNDKAPVETAKKGDEVAVSVEGATYGRQIREGQRLFTRVKDEDEGLLMGKFSNLIDDEERKLLDTIMRIKSAARNRGPA